MFKYKKDAVLTEGDQIGRYQGNTLILATIVKLEPYKIWCVPVHGDFVIEEVDGMFEWEGKYMRPVQFNWSLNFTNLWTLHERINTPLFSLSTSNIIRYVENDTWTWTAPTSAPFIEAWRVD